MPSQLGEPTKKQRAQMELYHLGFPCLLERHDLCGALYGKNLDDDPKDWLACQCFCHAERRRQEGMHHHAEKRSTIWTPKPTIRS